MDTETMGLVGFVLLLLIAATVVVSLLRRRASASGLDLALLETFRVRVRAWWILFTGLAAAFLCDQYLSRYLPGQTVTVILFGLISFWALREFITLTPTRPGDHRALFWVFFLCTPLQFVLVGMEGRWIFNEAHPRYLGFESYDVYSIFIPVYAFLFIPARVAMSGDAKRFLERTAKIQAGLLICVYCLSYAPALLTLEIPVSNPAGEANRESRGAESQGDAGSVAAPGGESGEASGRGSGTRAGGTVRLLFFFVLMTQLSDALQYSWSKLPSRHLIVPTISQTRTWEGLLGGAASVTLLGTALWFTTPFPQWWHAALTSLVIALMGFAGGLTMSAIKRDRGVKDFGTLVEGHGGVLDRIDSICFAAPVFFHLAHFLITGQAAPTGPPV
ncbi:MAG: phosphatidate cytidylyltransferase [Planctomycetota bacterium]